MTDSDAQALYYNNIAMDALVNNDVETAWLYAVNALFLEPANSHLWVNLGAIYRYSGQHQEAERSYLQALELDATEYSAMTNLVVLYGMEGREEDRAHWLAKGCKPPPGEYYYHAWQEMRLPRRTTGPRHWITITRQWRWRRLTAICCSVAVSFTTS